MKACRIKIIKRNFDQQLVEDYLSDSYREVGFGPCELFQDGQEFIVYDPNAMPQGFCAWAWADIQRELIAIMSGGELNWIRQKNSAVVCCTDAFRPVVFRIELIDQSEERICLKNSL
ncbi:TIGR04076 family protein [Candidatus Cloacimonadota bacterium]